MKVFVTGASGFVGSAVVAELLAAKHEVLALARTEASAKTLKDLGAQVHKGDIYDLKSMQEGASLTDGVIHTAFNHDFSKYVENCETDRQVIAAMAEVLKGSARPLIVTSGTAIATLDRLTTEQDPARASSSQVPRAASEEAATHARELGVLATIIRLPPSVHGKGDHGFVPMLIALARKKGHAAYYGTGENVWPAVHRRDAAVLYRRALEDGGQKAVFHANAEQGVPFKKIAEIIGKQLGLPTVSLAEPAAQEYFEFLAHFAQIHNPTSSQWTQEHLGWQPQQPTLLEDLAAGHYFEKSE